MNKRTYPEDSKLKTMGFGARYVGIGQTTFYKYVLAGVVPSIKLGKSRRVHIETLDRIIREGLPPLGTEAEVVEA